jgi:hypothetical protein
MRKRPRNVCALHVVAATRTAHRFCCRLERLAYGGVSNGFAESLNHLLKNQKRPAHGYRTWVGFRGQMLWTFGEVVDPDTVEVLSLRSLPRGEGARWLQSQFA